MQALANLEMVTLIPIHISEGCWRCACLDS
jgi:hypothetical protein